MSDERYIVQPHSKRGWSDGWEVFDTAERGVVAGPFDTEDMAERKRRELELEHSNTRW